MGNACVVDTRIRQSMRSCLQSCALRLLRRCYGGRLLNKAVALICLVLPAHLIPSCEQGPGFLRDVLLILPSCRAGCSSRAGADTYIPCAQWSRPCSGSWRWLLSGATPASTSRSQVCGCGERPLRRCCACEELGLGAEYNERNLVGDGESALAWGFGIRRIGTRQCSRFQWRSSS